MARSEEQRPVRKSIESIQSLRREVDALIDSRNEERLIGEDYRLKAERLQEALEKIENSTLGCLTGHCEIARTALQQEEK